MHLTRRMRFCFIIEEQYSCERMPMVVANQLRRSGHGVDVLEPSRAVTCLSDLARQNYDAYVLKTVSDGPGLCLLEAAEAAGIPAINNSRAIRFVRDKTILSALACAKGLPLPRTYFMVDPRLLENIPEKDYPLVLKPTNGSSGRGIHLIKSRAHLSALKITCPRPCFFLAQQYVENAGYDIKLYVIGEAVYAVARKSPLHPEMKVTSQLIPVQLEWLKLARRVGEIFGLDIYGLDVVATSKGPVVVDINDFPSFGHVPRAVDRLSTYILRIAEHARFRRRHRIPFFATVESSARTATFDAVRRRCVINPELHGVGRGPAFGPSVRHK
jgi:ribosomal protein S6--L-glutamate ligase